MRSEHVTTTFDVYDWFDLDRESFVYQLDQRVLGRNALGSAPR